MVVSVYFCCQSAALLNTVQPSVYIRAVAARTGYTGTERACLCDESLNELVVVG